MRRVLHSFMFFFCTSDVAADVVTSDHHLSVDADGIPQPIHSGSHLMRKAVPHESEPIQSTEFNLDGLLEVEDKEEEILLPTHWLMTPDRKLPGNPCQMMPSGMTASITGPKETWYSHHSWRYKTVSQCKEKCAASTACLGFEDYKGANVKRCNFKTVGTGTVVNTPPGGKDFYSKITDTHPYKYTRKVHKRKAGSDHTTIQTQVDPNATPVRSTGGTSSNKAGHRGRWRYNSDHSTVSSYYYQHIKDCKRLCSASSTCAGFNAFHSPSTEYSYCTFKTSVTGPLRLDDANCEVYVRKDA